MKTFDLRAVVVARSRSALTRAAAALALAGVAAFATAGPLTLDIPVPDRFGPAGSTQTFSGMIANDTGVDVQASDLFVDFAGFDPVSVSLVQLLGLPDFTIAAGTTSALVPLFQFTLAAATPPGVYFADVTLEDSANNFSDPVTVSVSTVPEPATWALLGAALLAGALRRGQLIARRQGVRS